MNLTDRSSRTGRLISALAITSVIALGVTACSGDGDPSSNSSVAPDAKKASAAVEAGLKAHSAGDIALATTSYNEALKYDATNKFAFYNLALIDESDANYGLAEENYRAALKTDAAYQPALFNLAILVTGRDPEEAITLYQAAVAANKKDSAAWLNLGLLLRTEGQVRLGNEAVIRAIALNPKLKDPAEAEKS